MKTNKVIASALAFIMATTVAAGSAYAAGEKVTISAGSQEVAPGAEFSIDIELADVPATGIMACEFALSYDASALTITGVEAGAVANTGADDAESDISGECPSFYADYSTAGTINLTWSTGLTDSKYWIAESGVFATIKGTVSESASGEYPIEIVPISRDDISGTNNAIFIGYVDANGGAVEYESAVSNGAIIVSAQTETTTQPTETTTTTTATESSVTTTTTTTATESGEQTTTTTTATEAPATSGSATTVTTVTTKEGTSGTTGVVTGSLCGDVNLDGTITLLDVVYLNKYIAKVLDLVPEAKANANTLDDGTETLNGADTIALLKYIVRLVDSLPQNPA